MKWEEKERVQLRIFLVFTFGITYLLGILQGISYKAGNPVGIFAGSQMLYPSVGVMLALLITETKEVRMPRLFYKAFISCTLIVIILCICSVVLPENNWEIYSEWVLILGSIICWGTYFIEDTTKLTAYGIAFKQNNRKQFFSYLALFLLLYFAVDMITVGIAYIGGNKDSFRVMLDSYRNFPLLLGLIPNFFITFIAFFGEEYGWRGFLQPMLQKYLGMRRGIILLGVIWGVWHLPLNLFYYAPTTWLPSLIQQIVLCVSIGIFMGYVYLKTEDIWLPIVIHYLNNSVQGVLYGAGVATNQTVTWGVVVITSIVLIIFYALFIKSKIFECKEILKRLTWPKEVGEGQEDEANKKKLEFENPNS